jgi:methylisocitrate lyase
MISPGKKLRRLLKQGPVLMPGAYNAATGRLVQRAGFGAVYISGAGLSNATAGVPDVGVLSQTEVAQLAGYIARVVTSPALVDADTGFGGPENVTRTIEDFERAGLAGCHIEDQEFPKRCGHLSGKRIVPEDEMVAKIKIAVKARRDADFLIVARTDARGVEGFDAAVKRAHSYLQAGADMIFPEALESENEFRHFAQAVRAPLLANMTEFGKSPLLSAKILGNMGYKIIIFPQSCFRLSMKASEEFLQDLKKKGTQAKWLKRMQTRAELYELLQYNPNKN